MITMIIETEHLRLVGGDMDILKSALSSNDQLSNKLGVSLADKWTEFGIEAIQYSLERLLESREESGWWTYFPIHKRDNTLIGSGGYKGKPTAEGTVELGYEIAPSYRNKGLATEMTKGLIANAFKNARVSVILAHTLGQENSSTHVLTKCGFQKVEEINDPQDGLLWKWELRRAE